MSTARKRFLILGLLVLTVVAGFTLRTAVNHGAATTDDGEFLLSGNDPYYYQRAVEHIVETGETIQFDEMLNFPIGSVNPNPPLYMWSMAIGSEVVEPFVDSQDTAMWISLLYAPSVWGALTVIPAYLIGRDLAGRWGGLLAGFLLATSPEHMSRTSLGFSDHEALYLFLVAMGMFYVMSALRRVGTPSQHTSILDVWGDFGRWFTRHRKAAGSAVVAGALFGGVALSWKGFPYVFGILLAYGGIQFLMNHWRGKDVARPLYVLATAAVVALLVAFPHYWAFGLVRWWTPALYLTSALLAAGLFLLAFQRYPAVLVVPGLAVLASVLAAIMFVVYPDIAAALLNRFVYFQENRLYQTIAEARPSGVSNLSFAVGPIPFFLYITGFFWLIYRVYDAARPAETFFLCWVAVDMFMAVSAVRFLFTSSVTMATLAAVTLIWLIRSMDLPSLVEGYKRAGGGWRGIRRGTGFMHVVLIIFVGLFVLVPNGVIAVDAAVPQDLENQRIQSARADAFEAAVAEARAQGLSQEDLQEIQDRLNQSRSPDQFRSQLGDLADRPTSNLTSAAADDIADAASPHLETISTYTNWFGAFGQSYLPDGWKHALDYLAEQDTDEEPEERPGAISWWDYGHWTISQGDHPAVADNFQNGFRTAGNFLVAQNETHAIQILSGRYADALDQDTFVDTLTERGIDEARAEAYYQTATKETYPFLTFESDTDANREASVDWLTDLEDELGKEIRYVMTDNRMLPIDNPRTQRIENPSIFYAPVTLAGEDPDEFVEDSLVQLGTGEKITQEELQQLQRENPNQQPNVGQRLFFKQPFFDSMYYRTFVGMPAREPFEQQGQQFPIPFRMDSYPEFFSGGEDMLLTNTGATEVNGLAMTQETAPGFGLRHFRLDYANQNVRVLQYTPGATVEGTVTVSGEPMEGVRVTAFDDAGEQVLDTNPGYFASQNRTAEDMDVPHDSTLTDADGRYELVTPYGDDRGVEIRAVKTSQSAARSPLGGGGSTVDLASERVNITIEEAEQGETFRIDLQVQPANLTGSAFVDANANGEREPGEEGLEDVELELQGTNLTTGPDGEFRFEELTPGSYRVNASAEGFQLRSGQASVTLESGQTLEQDLAFEHEFVDVNGTVVDEGGSPVEGVEAVFEPAANDTARRASAVSQAAGNLSLQMQPGTYEVSGNGTPPGSNTTLEVDRVEVVDGTGVRVTDDTRLEVDPQASGVELRVHVVAVEG